MRQNEALFEYSAAGLPLLARGKVRDILCVGDDHLLMVATDRLSAYDVVLPDPIPGKGEVLTQLSLFWFRMMSNLVDNHLTDISVNDVVSDPQQREILGKRAVVVRRLKPLPVEAVVRGYLIGSGWRDYQKTGRVCGIALPAGMQQAQKLPAPLFTPSSKASAGDHDENIPYADVVDLIGETLAGRVRDLSIAIYQRASDYAEQRGIIVADTKFEFGVDDEGKLYLIDEVLTPDSSRFWPIDEYAVGTSPASFDKQFVRDYLDTLDWDKKPPGPELPEDILKKTSDKYHEAFRRLTGRPLC